MDLLPSRPRSVNYDGMVVAFLLDRPIKTAWAEEIAPHKIYQCLTVQSMVRKESKFVERRRICYHYNNVSKDLFTSLWRTPAYNFSIASIGSPTKVLLAAHIKQTFRLALQGSSYPAWQGRAQYIDPPPLLSKLQRWKISKIYSINCQVVPLKDPKWKPFHSWIGIKPTQVSDIIICVVLY